MAAYPGQDFARVSYAALLHSSAGIFTGEVPALPGLEASGGSKDEVCRTLQSLLEEHVECILDEGGVLPLPDADSMNGLRTDSSKGAVSVEHFYILVPAEASPSKTSPGSSRAGSVEPAESVDLKYTGIILRRASGFQAYFPDIPGAFTSGETFEEIEVELQNLLVTYIGGLVKLGQQIPKPGNFTASGAQSLDLSDDDVVSTPTCIVKAPSHLIQEKR